jgi:hypothetical protein
MLPNADVFSLALLVAIGSFAVGVFLGFTARGMFP